MDYNTEKKCQNKCPKCGSEDIEWEKLKDDICPYIDGICCVCRCNFQEVYEYSITVYNDDKEKQENKND